jgi:hypothetical protein
MYKTIFGDQKYRIVFLADLHSYWKVIKRFWWKEDIHCFLRKNGSTLLMVDLDNMELQHVSAGARCFSTEILTFAPAAVLTANVNNLYVP